MQPHEFIAKWRNVELKERSASQSHFIDLCRLLEVDDPTTADPAGDWFTFEMGASKTGGGEGWADVWRKGCFAWEYKGKKKDLDKAFAQLQQYAIALENPPLLIVSDMDRFRIHTNWTNTVQQVHEFSLGDLADGATRDLLRDAFLHPERLRPAKTRQMLTEEAAQEFAQLAQRLRSRGHEGHEVAHFVNRLVFCMFAEDVGLLPDHMFSKMLKASRSEPEEFADNASTLFAAMHSGGRIDFTRIDWFNGGLFDDDTALALDRDDIDNLIAAANLDWSEVDPSILGTLFERGLDPDKRSQLGAHYTDRDKIMQIVEPIIIRPLSAEWDEVKASIAAAMEKVAQAKARVPEKQSDAKKVYAAARRAEERAFRSAVAAHAAYIDRLRNFRVLDPACGSGNFLYLSLLALKDLEHLANLDAEALGLGRFTPTVGPESVLGIELNPYAAELARVSVWIGEIQWMRRNGFEASRNPILRSLGNIECRDAVLDVETGERATWPEADVVVGNPPFLGSHRMIAELGEPYTVALRNAWSHVSGGSDLVCYWFAGAWDRMVAGKLERAGLVSTNSIRGGANREVLKPIVEHGRIFEAWGDEAWTVEGAAVRVSLVCFDRGHGDEAQLDGGPVPRIHSDLTGGGHGIDLTSAHRLPDNANVCFQGMKFVGEFPVEPNVARTWLAMPLNPNGRPNSDVVKRWQTGMDITRRSEDRWVIDFGNDMPLADAQLYEAPFEHVIDNVKPARELVRRENHRVNWWRYGEARPGMRKGLSGLSRYLATPEVAKHRVFVWEDQGVVPTGSIYAIAREDDTTFGILHCYFHEIWALRMGTFLGVGNDPRYTPSTTFETFPFPEGLTPNTPAADYAENLRAQAIANAAARLNELRENWLNPPDLIERVPEVVPGYPDRILPKDEAAAQVLKTRTLTNLYNQRPAWLDRAHGVLDEAVADAYGWGDEFRAGTLTDDEILARLFHLNQERAGSQ